MALHITAGLRYGALILTFFYTSSAMTRYGETRKKAVEEDFKEGGQRNWIQVLCNSVIATVLVLLVGVKTNWQDKCLDTKDSVIVTSTIGGIIGHYACCNGDTWSSEYGVLSDAQPRLVTTFKKVRRGTNGGVTSDGLWASVAAGAVVGLAFYLVDVATASCSFNVAIREIPVIPIAMAAGLCGSLIDSLLGATVQYSGWCKLRKKVVGKPGPTVTHICGADILSNNGVNFVSALLTTVLTGLVCSRLF